MQTHEQSTLLKFLSKNREHKNKIEKRCMPEQTYGVSAESPIEFKQSHTLTNPLGYEYKHDDNVLIKGVKESIPFSQRKFFTIDNSQPSKALREEMSKALDVNPLVFHRRKGLLSEYMDKNGWMSKVHKLMGYERSETARACSNRDRQLRMRHLRKSPNNVEFQVTPVLQKPVDKTYFETIPALMGEKMRIRRSRNRFASEIQSLKVLEEVQKAEAFKIDNFEKRELSLQMSKRAQTSRTYGERFSMRTISPEFKKTNGFRSTRAESFKGGVSQRLDLNEFQREETENSDFELSKLYRTEKVIPNNK